MLKASRNPRAGFRKDFTYRVTTDTGDDEIATINETKLTIDLGGRQFSVNRKGVLGPEFELKSGENVIATASQKPFFNHYRLVAHDGQEWTFKAVGLLALKFGLFQGNTQVGTIATRWANRLKDISVDLPDNVPREVQVFLLLLLVRMWSDTTN